MNEKHRGYFGIGVYLPKTEVNIGTLFRSAQNMGSSFIYTIGHRYRHQSSDTMKSWKSIPLYAYKTFDEFYKSMPKDCLLVGIEQSDRSEDIRTVNHPERAVYLLGAEDYGLPKEIQEECHRIIEIPSTRCINVSVAGSIVIYDRLLKGTYQHRMYAQGMK